MSSFFLDIYIDCSMVFEKIWNFRFFNIQKNRSHKLSMQEEKQRQFWNLHWILHKKTQNDFQFSSYLFFYIFVSISKDMLFWTFDLQKKFFWHENWKSLCVTLSQIQCRFQNCLCFSSSIDSFCLLLFFWRFKNTFYWSGKCIYMHILSIIRVFEAINTSNQGTISSWMIFQPSCFILYSIFSMNLVFLMKFFYNDVTTLLWRRSFFDSS